MLKIGADAEFFSHRTYIFHGKMIFLGEKETDIDIGKKLFALLRGNVDLYAEGFENVSGSGFGGGCPVAMLGNGNAAGSNDESRSGGDIEGVGAVAAGTYDLQNVHVVEKFFSVGSHGSCGSGDLVDGLRPSWKEP